ncbi:hypothetical protein LCGC14_0669830 [marine sediment metagenome]|uniref:Phosphotyrosine protein phosphatase I domain-containing protein n=1 Tax=marine sediment metagenome TaxID=412755 RepID=A0A0F9QWG1_9ZZZZ
MRKLRVLTICLGGTNRSTGLADYLRGNMGCDALPASHHWTQDETLEMLCKWADVIIPVEPEYADRPYKMGYRGKTIIFDIGPDVFGAPRNEALQKIFKVTRHKELKVLIDCWKLCV